MNETADGMTRRRVLLIAAVAGVMLLMVGTRPITDVDMFWQLQLGQMILHDNQLVSADPFTFTHWSEKFPPLCWLAQVVYAILYPLGGWRLLQITDNLAFVGAFAVAALSVRGSEARSAAVASAMGLAFVVGLSHNSLRPQTFALFGMALLLALRSARFPSSGAGVAIKVISGTLLLIVWQNLHPSVVVAGVVLMALVIADAWDWWHGERNEQIIVDLGLLLGAGCAQFATPMGIEILAISARNKELSLNETQPAIEWLPCWDPRVRAVTVPSLGLAAVVTLVLLGRARFRLKAADALLLLVMAGLSAWMWRFGFFAAVVLLPVWARLIERALPSELFADKEEKEGPSVALVGAVALIVVLAAATVSVLARSELFSPDLPQEGMRKLRTQMRDGKIYNFQPYGGPLTFTSKRQWQVLMDGRIYVYTDKEWKDYYAAARGDIPIDQLVEQHKPDAFFLHPFVQQGLIERLKKHLAWHLLYQDKHCVIFVRGEPETGIARAQQEGER